VHFVSNSGKGALLTRVLSDPAVERALVFTRTKRGADRVAKRLTQDGIQAEAIHGNKSQNNRERTLDAFRRGHTRVLVATDIAARGIDVDGITHVINYEMPNIPESYVHRIGRTARAGASGFAISLCDSEERAYLRDIETLMRRQVRVEGSATGDRVEHGREDRGADRPRRANVEGARKPHGAAAHAQGRSTRGYSAGSRGNSPARGAHASNSAPRHAARGHDAAAAVPHVRGAYSTASTPRHGARAHDASARSNGAHVPARSPDSARETRGHAHHGHNAPARPHTTRGPHATHGSAHATDSPGVKRRHGPHSQDNSSRPQHRSNADSQHSRTAYKPHSSGHGGPPNKNARTGR
jgi:ATP-dependent RNA helicase RhlE